MAFTKIITPGSQDLGEPVAQLVKVSSRGSAAATWMIS